MSTPLWLPLWDVRHASLWLLFSYFCVTNNPQIQQLKTISMCYTVSESQESGSSWVVLAQSLL